MRTIVLLSVFVAVLNASVIEMRTTNFGSLRAKLIAEDKLSDYLAEIALARTQVLASGTQTLVDFNDDFYVGNITVGTPPQVLTVVPDTGSSDMWVIDAACKSKACQGTTVAGYPPKDRFNTTQSSSFTKVAMTFIFEYATGPVTGYYATDTITFGGMTVDVQEFGVATRLSRAFGVQPIDGVMGLGWPAIAANKVTPPMQNILGKLDQPIFTVWLDKKITATKGGYGGLITYGALDHANCGPTWNYVPLSAETYWQFPITGFTMGSYSQTRTDQVYSDTGSNWIGAPTTAMNSIITQTKAVYDQKNQIYLVPCTGQKTLPALVFKISGNDYTVPATEYVIDIGLGNGNCVITFFSMGTGGGFGPSWLLGDTFIRTYCNVYDIGQKRIGFSLAKHQMQ